MRRFLIESFASQSNVDTAFDSIFFDFSLIIESLEQIICVELHFLLIKDFLNFFILPHKSFSYSKSFHINILNFVTLKDSSLLNIRETNSIIATLNFANNCNSFYLKAQLEKFCKTFKKGYLDSLLSIILNNINSISKLNQTTHHFNLLGIILSLNYLN